MGAFAQARERRANRDRFYRSRSRQEQLPILRRHPFRRLHHL